MSGLSFTAHNIRLDDGTVTKTDVGITMEQQPIFRGAKRLIRMVFPRRLKTVNPWLRPFARMVFLPVSLADIGCLEGGFSVEFARMGLEVTGLDVRESNIAACQYVKSRVDLPNLRFIKDDAWNIGRYGPFDIVFCVGLFYHVDKPRDFLRLLAENTRKMLFIDTHFSTANDNVHCLSEPTEHDGMLGRWYTEFTSEQEFEKREEKRWASWDNRRSFWLMREEVIQLISDCGFNVVLEQYDHLGPDIRTNMTKGFYHIHNRNTFVGVKL
jgi:hypothetical protein